MTGSGCGKRRQNCSFPQPLLYQTAVLREIHGFPEPGKWDNSEKCFNIALFVIKYHDTI